MATRIFLDVDGVLNAVRDNNPQFWEEWKVEVCDGYNIRHALDMGRALQAIFERDKIANLSVSIAKPPGQTTGGFCASSSRGG